MSGFGGANAYFTAASGAQLVAIDRGQPGGGALAHLKVLSDGRHGAVCINGHKGLSAPPDALAKAQCGVTPMAGGPVLAVPSAKKSKA